MIDEKKLIDSIKDVEVAWYIDGNYTTYDSTTIMDIIDKQPIIEKCADCSRRKFYQQGYEDGKNTDKWIPCSERFPENEQEVEISCKRTYIGSGDEKRTTYFTARGFYTDGNMNTEDSGFWWEDCDNWEYDEEKDAYKIPEGWWEYVTFSERFGVVDAEVLAWKPLSEPYKK